MDSRKSCSSTATNSDISAEFFETDRYKCCIVCWIQAVDRSLPSAVCPTCSGEINGYFSDGTREWSRLGSKNVIVRLYVSRVDGVGWTMRKEAVQGVVGAKKLVASISHPFLSPLARLSLLSCLPSTSIPPCFHPLPNQSWCLNVDGLTL